MKEFYPSIPQVKYEGTTSKNPMAFKWYNPDELVDGKPMREQLKFAMSYWHTMCAELTDMFGVGTIDKSYGTTDLWNAKTRLTPLSELMDKHFDRLLLLPRPRHRARG